MQGLQLVVHGVWELHQTNEENGQLKQMKVEEKGQRLLDSKDAYGTSWTVVDVDAVPQWSKHPQLNKLSKDSKLMAWDEIRDYRKCQGLSNSSRQSSFEYLSIKTCPPSKLRNRFGFSVPFCAGIDN